MMDLAGGSTLGSGGGGDNSISPMHSRATRSSSQSYFRQQQQLQQQQQRQQRQRRQQQKRQQQKRQQKQQRERRRQLRLEEEEQRQRQQAEYDAAQFGLYPQQPQEIDVTGLDLGDLSGYEGLGSLDDMTSLDSLGDLDDLSTIDDLGIDFDNVGVLTTSDLEPGSTAQVLGASNADGSPQRIELDSLLEPVPVVIDYRELTPQQQGERRNLIVFPEFQIKVFFLPNFLIGAENFKKSFFCFVSRTFAVFSIGRGIR